MAFHPYPRLIRWLFNANRFGPPRTVTFASSWPWVDHIGFGSAACNWSPISDSLSLRLRVSRHLTLLQTSNSPDHYAKGTPSAACGASSALSLRPLVGTRFQVLFHSPPGVLFTFPSRYLFTIGHERVFSLTRWSSQIPAGFHVSCGTWVSTQGANALSSTGLSPSMVRLPRRFD